MVKNPVMFVTMVGAVLTTVGIFTGASAERGFITQLALWLWFTVLFANFAEAMAEGRGKAQADALRKARKDIIARRLRGGREEKAPAQELQKGDLVVCEAGDTIPADGDVVEGIASVDESAITGESAPVIRESSGDRSPSAISSSPEPDSGINGSMRGPPEWTFRLRITSIETVAVAPFGDATGAIGSRVGWLFVKVGTDQGVSGLGECSNWPRSGNQVIGNTFDYAGHDAIDEEATVATLIQHNTIAGTVELLPDSLIARANRITDRRGVFITTRGSVALG